MAITNPTKPGEYEVSEEEKRILDERLETLDADRKRARPAADVMRDLRQKYKPAPR